MNAKTIEKELSKYANKDKAKILQGFFKTGKGQYGEGDVFIGVKVPESRTVAKKFKDAPFSEVKKLLQSKVHEHRLTALLLLVHNFELTHDKKIVDYYLANTKYVNNWDLVDLTSHKILGEYLIDKKKERKVLYELSKSKNMWERRIAIVSCFAFIRQGDLNDAYKLAEQYLTEQHDLMHKATGWVLRECGKKDQPRLEKFLDKHVKKMPRTMLRYAIERFEEKKRKEYLKK